MFPATDPNEAVIASLYAVSFPASKRAQGSSQTVQPEQLTASAAAGARRVASRTRKSTNAAGNLMENAVRRNGREHMPGNWVAR